MSNPTSHRSASPRAARRLDADRDGGHLTWRDRMRARELAEQTLAHAGGRSARAIEFLEGVGLDVVNVAGGISEWYRLGLPVTLGATR